ncbi:carboxypeptidase A2-like isoform X2 [Galleria mellonella]|uniref:Carboxypeptidase A2-like isoform X2 n=1 Tax=Galleria mellonella TaxID=7137 RepID=A0ABM3MHD0_GALME|nr:carboxypeptidase A2-like isoform X2 [Galleria mellonella]
MARRLALLALLACAAVALTSPPRSLETSDSASFDPFELWEDSESFEPVSPLSTTKRPSAKVILRNKGPKVNVTVKKTKDDNKKNIIKRTNIKIESHTNFIVTKRPFVTPNIGNRIPYQPIVYGENEQFWFDENMEQIASWTTRRPTASRRPTLSTMRPPTKPKRVTTTRRPTTITHNRQSISTTPKTTKTQQKTTCPPKKTAWFSTLFQGDNKLKKKPSKKPTKPGIFMRIYNWISKSTWFGGASWFEKQPKPNQSSTTVSPWTMPNSDWYSALLNSEINDGVYFEAINTDKRMKKKSPRISYKGYQLLRIYPKTKEKVTAIVELQEEGDGSGLMWWSNPTVNGYTDLLTPPDLLEDVKHHLSYYNIDFDILIRDLQKAIVLENPKFSKKERLEANKVFGHPMSWRRYHRYADILRYLDYLQHAYGELVELIMLGNSSEGLPLVAVKISMPTNETRIKDRKGKDKKKWKLGFRSKPAIWLDGGSHAREWISPAVATWIMQALIEGEKGQGADYEMLKQADFYIMPVLNPDGYEHSHTHDRLWKKTRSLYDDQSDDFFVGWLPWNWGRGECVGVDVDRNWDYHWGEQDSSRDRCADNYAGPHPFSEPETKAVSEFLTERKGHIKAYISLHAYSQTWLVPSAPTTVATDDDSVLMEMGKLATAALADVYGTKYQVGTATEMHQQASGMSHDWAKARAGIKFSYHVDLGDSIGPYGYILPAAQIVSTARETWEAVKVIIDNLSSS